MTTASPYPGGAAANPHSAVTSRKEPSPFPARTRSPTAGSPRGPQMTIRFSQRHDHSAPCTALKTAAMIGHPAKGAIWLKVNGKVTQKGDLSEMIWNVPETIAYLSKLVTLRSGDLIMSGTPAGVGPVRAGDRLEGHVEGVGELTVNYAK